MSTAKVWTNSFTTVQLWEQEKKYDIVAFHHGIPFVVVIRQPKQHKHIIIRSSIINIIQNEILKLEKSF